ncbi:transcription-repair coupling factor [Clostridium vitabionis]|uniref:transcription-repair coupling factor n=1 Tax=Clostridium vitabionis TaxID=2784388 RepID=UPI001889DA84|nr:transcription-repair coupling factor [Clostridium vitabionis]
MKKSFLAPLEELAGFTELREAIQKKQGPVQLSGCLDSQKMHVAMALGEISPWRLIVAQDEQKAREIADDCRCFAKNVYIFPPRDLLFYSSDIHGSLLTRQRMEVVRHIAEDAGGTIVTTVDAMMEHLLSAEKLTGCAIRVNAADTLDAEKLAGELVRLGYEKNAQVEGPGEFAVRGGIIDIFPLTEENPFRIELWGDEVDSIRSFDPESQRSIENLDHVEIFPATEMVLTREEVERGIPRISAELEKQSKLFRGKMLTEEAFRLESAVGEVLEELRENMVVRGLESYLPYFTEDTVSFPDYLPKDTVIFLDEPQHLAERAKTVEKEFVESMRGRIESGNILPGQAAFLYPAEETLRRLSGSRTVCLLSLDQRLPGIPVRQKFSLDTAGIASYRESPDLLRGDLARWKKERYRVLLLAGGSARAGRLAGELRDYGLSAYCPDSPDDEVKPGEIMILTGSLHRGFAYPMIRLIVITESDMFGAGKEKRRRKAVSPYAGQKIRNFSQLQVGDYVVHEKHGLGIYRGIRKMDTEEGPKDFITIEYRDSGKLYIPATALDRIQKYASADAEKVPKINRLGGTEWKKTKTRVKTEVEEVAKDLVKLYAARQRLQGFQYGPDTVWQREFEDSFPYEETEDQLQAIQDTKNDMESGKIMDRLICGDVGYGKTEIALRAAFKAVQDGRQVAFLVPTTILCQQHYNTFVQRMKDYPVNIGILSRFATASAQKKTIAGLKSGQVDIVIGTHRLLSKDVTFKSLGLLIVDEEQRFGVTHKEKIKKLRENVDVLTLTATPIPRTLHMSLVGIRDMSVLEEPPVDRRPIQTYVMEYSPEIVREAIRRELGRGGQVYYLYNRVQSIADMTAQIQKLVPEAQVAFAHGQMKEQELERIMLDFVNGDIDVLVSTTIIETGLDIPNANTIIIHDADRMGLSQLYQLRGRVGRTNRNAYAFLMYRRNKVLREEAEKRLQAIRQFTELGSGIRIAMRDLEIRGAGNVLGRRQSGHMDEVGYDLYCKLLNEAVLALKGEAVPDEDFDTEVKCEINAYIPDTYIRNESQKLDIYRRISSFTSHDDCLDMQDELTDRYGDIPKPVENLLLIADVRAAAHRAFVSVLNVEKQEFTMHMYPHAALDPSGIPDFLEKHKDQMTFRAGSEPFFTYRDRGEKHIDAIPMLKTALEILTDFIQLTVVPMEQKRRENEKKDNS